MLLTVRSLRVRERTQPWQFFVSLAVLVILGFCLRFYGLSDESPWNDEVLTLAHLAAPNHTAFMQQIFQEDPVPRLSPVYYHLLFAWSRLFGPDITSARLFSVVLGTATIILLALLARRAAGPRAGLIAAALLALSLPHIYFSQEVRFYALVSFEAAAAFYFLLLAQRQPRWWAAHLFCNALLLFTHAFAPLAWAGQSVWLLHVYRRHPRVLLGWAGAHAVLLGCYAVWGWAVVGYDFAAQSGVFNDVPPTWRELAMSLLLFTGARFSSDAPAPYMLGQLSADLLLGGILLAITVNAMRNPPARTLLLSALLPVLLLFLAAILWKPVFLYRYVLFASLPLVSVFGIGIASIHSRGLQNAVLLLVFVGLLWQDLALQRPFRPDFQRMAETVQAVDAAAPVIALKPFVHRAAAFALKDVKEAAEVRCLIGEAPLLKMLGDLPSQQTAWVVFHRWDRLAQFEASVQSSGLTCKRHDAGGIPPLTYYHLRKE